MTTITLRKAGAAIPGDYTTLDDAFVAISVLVSQMGGLTDHVTLNVQGGESFGVINQYYNLTGDDLVFNDFNITIQTDPSERSTPATLVGRFYERSVNSAIPNTTAVISFDNLVLENDYTLCEINNGTSGAIWPVYNNCLIYLTSRYIFIGGPSSQTEGGFNNCSIFIVKNEASIILGESPQQLIRINNTLFCVFRDTDIAIDASLEYYLDSCTFYNYGAGDVTLSFINPATNSVVDTDPNLTDQVIQALSDTLSVMSARAATPTELSEAILANAASGTATDEDIIGTSRPQGAAPDRGAYELEITPVTDEERLNNVQALIYARF